MKNGQKNWNAVESLKAFRKNYIDTNKEKKGIFCETGAFYYLYILHNLVFYSYIYE